MGDLTGRPASWPLETLNDVPQALKENNQTDYLDGQPKEVPRFSDIEPIIYWSTHFAHNGTGCSRDAIVQIVQNKARAEGVRQAQLSQKQLTAI